MLQTKLDAQCDKLATELSSQRLRVTTVDVFELHRVIYRKSPILTYPPAVGTSVGGDPV